MKTFLLFTIFFLSQVSSNVSPKIDGPLDFSFFIGEWKGKGEFSNGKKIEATISFEKMLNSRWIRSRHKDLAPNTYEAESFWPARAENPDFAVHVFDNFGSSRNFTTNGWIDDEIVLVAETANEGNWRWQKFVYQKTGKDSFKMTFEVSSDGNEWRMIDYLLFERLTEK